VQVLVQWELQRPQEDLVEGSEEGEVAVAVVVVVVVVVLLEVHLDAHRAAPDPEAPLLPVADPGVLHLAIPASLVVVMDPLERTDYPPSPMVPVRVPVLASWGDSALVEFLDLPLVDTAGGAVATMGQPLVETVPLTCWFLPW
jgi:hypothetical protein